MEPWNEWPRIINVMHRIDDNFVVIKLISNETDYVEHDTQLVAIDDDTCMSIAHSKAAEPVVIW